jgi:hypothetical protein
MTLIPAFGRQMQKDCEFEAMLGCIEYDLVSKKMSSFLCPLCYHNFLHLEVNLIKINVNGFIRTTSNCWSREQRRWEAEVIDADSMLFLWINRWLDNKSMDTDVIRRNLEGRAGFLWKQGSSELVLWGPQWADGHGMDTGALVLSLTSRLPHAPFVCCLVIKYLHTFHWSPTTWE